jgi:hypothetical protein
VAGREGRRTMEGVVFKYWIEEVERYPNYHINFTLCDNIGIVIRAMMLNGSKFMWEKFYRWENIKRYRLHDILRQFVSEYNFHYEEYKRRIDNGEE